MKPSIRCSLVAIAALVATAAFAPTVTSAQVTCGSNITTKAVMDTDLTCVVSPAVTIGAEGSVDMAGHSITTCAGCDGVLLSGAGAKLSNGAILSGGGAGSQGVILNGGTHLVENIVVVNAQNGFESSSDKNKIKNCTALGAIHGFRIVANKNAISRSYSGGSDQNNFFVIGDNNNLTENTSSNLNPASAGAGFLISGNANKLSRNNSTDDAGVLAAFYVEHNGNKLSLNSVTGSVNHGLRVNGDENKVSKTVANDNTFAGIIIEGNSNKFSKNTASQNGTDGITSGGSFNNINGSNCSDNGGDGIHVYFGDALSMKSNVMMRNGDAGVHIIAGTTNSKISKTVALANSSVDLQDDNANCGSNVWAKSVFGSSDAGGVADHACIE